MSYFLSHRERVEEWVNAYGDLWKVRYDQKIPKQKLNQIFDIVFHSTVSKISDKENVSRLDITEIFVTDLKYLLDSVQTENDITLALVDSRDDVLKLFGSNLRRVRLKKAMTQSQLGKKLNMHQVQIARIETGVIDTATSNVYLLAKTLKVSVSELFKEL